MAKWVAAILALVVAAGAYYYFSHIRPQQQALEAERARAAQLDLEVSLLRPRHHALEAVREELDRANAELKAQLAAAQGPAEALQSRVAELEAAREALQRASGDLKQQVAAKEKELAALRATQQELVEDLKKEIAAQQIQVERVRDQLRVELVEEVLFDSGEAVIKPAGLGVLKRVGLILKKAEHRNIDVEGHTDNVPIGAELAKRFPTNWELSTARATNVARFLQDAVKIDPRLLSATGYSEYRPRAPNTTAEGRRKNRRIEILLGPVLQPVKPGTR
jgi:chemotaxis protein MotB